ncbi:molybdopterin cofactor-binding domain-containing protein [Escherichia coli]
MRGYGAPQVVFAVESMLDDAATALGIDPVEIRLRTPPAKEMLIRSRANVFTAQGCRSVLKKAGKSLNGKNAVQNARTSKAICAAALASPVLATPLTPGLSA